LFQNKIPQQYINSFRSAVIALFFLMDLQHIKVLFLQTRYKSCIRACHDTLAALNNQTDQNPLSDTFVMFYLAMAHEELARAMHQNSTNKIPTMDTARAYYHEALDALPSSDDAHDIYIATQRANELKRAESRSSFSSFGDDTWEIAGNDSTSTLRFQGTPTSNSFPRLRNDSPLDDWSKQGSPTSRGFDDVNANDVDFDDLDSHRSFDQIRTPGRGLPRDYSRISLIASPSIQVHKTEPAHRRVDSAMQHNLWPDRPSTPAPDRPFSPHQNRPSLPQLSIVAKPTHASSLSPPDSEYYSPEYMDPVSPLCPADYASASSNSPISPTTPTAAFDTYDVHSAVSTQNGYEEEEFHDAEESFVAADHFRDNVEGMRARIRRHISQLHDTKSTLLANQAAKRHRRTTLVAQQQSEKEGLMAGAQKPPTRTTALGPQQVPSTRSYWSFVPAHIKATEKQERIAAGRARNWERKRFQPERYQELCEQALGDL
jgi:hypothetical protein